MWRADTPAWWLQVVIQHDPSSMPRLLQEPYENDEAARDALQTYADVLASKGGSIIFAALISPEGTRYIVVGNEE